MGLLIKHATANIIKFNKLNDYAAYYRADEPPYTVGKLVKLKDADEAIDFKTRQLQYYIGQVTGYKIFFVHAGFHEVPKLIVSDAQVKHDIDNICKWYKEIVIPGNNSLKIYKL